MSIIGLYAEADSGKTFTADFLVKNCNFVELTNSSALKDNLSRMTGWDREKLNGNNTQDKQWRETFRDENFYNLTPREAMRYYGTDIMRNWKPNIWCDITERDIKSIISKNTLNLKNIVISDCRFKNEIEMIQKLGGKVIYIQRSTNNSETIFTHASENMDCAHLCDYKILNTFDENYIPNFLNILNLKCDEKLFFF